MRVIRAWPIAAASLFVWSLPAHATIVQEVSAGYLDRTVVDGELKAVTDPVDPLTDFRTASATGPYGSAIAAIGAFGNLGVRGELKAPAFIDTFVNITNSYVPNLTGSDRNARLLFIIDGGLLALDAGEGSTLAFDLSLRADIFTGGGDNLSSTTWESHIWMERTATDLQTTYSDEDIGAAPGMLPWQIEIPLSFQSFDIGVIPGAGYAAISYDVDVSARAVVFAEVVNYRFSDPAKIDGFQEAPRVEFLDQVADVPAPPTLPMLATGLALVFRRLRRAKGAAT